MKAIVPFSMLAIGLGGVFTGAVALAGIKVALLYFAGVIVVTCLLCAPVAIAAGDTERRSKP